MIKIEKNLKINLMINLGTSLEYFDFVLFLHLIPIINQIFFPESGGDHVQMIQYFGLFLINIVAKILGSFVLGVLSIKFGNMYVMMTSIYMMSLSSFLIGFLPTYDEIGFIATISIVILRFTQAIAFSVEIPANVSFIMNNFKDKLPLKIAILITSATLGSIMASYTMYFLYKIFTNEEILEYAWRIPFIFGGFLAFIAVYLRRFNFQKIEKVNQKNYDLLSILDNKKLLIKTIIFLLLPASMIVIYIYLPKILLLFFSIPLVLSYKATSFGLIISVFSAIFAGIYISKFKDNYIKIITIIFIVIYPIMSIYLYNNNKFIFIFTAVFQFFLTNFMVNSLFKIGECFSSQPNSLHISIVYNIAFVIAGFIPLISINYMISSFTIIVPIILAIIYYNLFNKRNYIM